MAIFDEPPPSYSATPQAPSSPRTPTLLHLPDHILLQILSSLPLPALSLSVRSVNRQLHLLASHILRRALLPVWTSKTRPGNSSDPLGTHARGRGVEAKKRGRELAVLDLFISACVTEAVRAHESELFLLPSASASTEGDIFDLFQPRARVEDLVILYGVQDRIVLPEDTPIEKDGDGMVRAQDLVVTLTGRSARLSLPFPSANQKGIVVLKTVVEVGRREDDSLEKVAEALVDRLAHVPLKRFGGEKGCRAGRAFVFLPTSTVLWKVLGMSLDSTLDGFFSHADHPTVSAFTLGFLTFLALRSILLAADVPRHLHTILGTHLAHVLCEPSDAPSTRSNEDQMERGERFEGEKETVADSPASSPTRIGGAKRDPRRDPQRLTQILNFLVLFHALGLFGTLLAFKPGAAPACTFLTGWAVISGGGMMVVAFLQVIVEEIRDADVAWPYEVLSLCLFLGVRLGLNFAAAAVTPGVIHSLPTPFPSVALCLPRPNLAVGATISSFDLALAVYLFIRFLFHAGLKGKDKPFSEPLRWRRVARLVLRRAYAKITSLILIVASNFAGSIGRTTVARTVVPPSLAVLLTMSSGRVTSDDVRSDLYVVIYESEEAVGLPWGEEEAWTEEELKEDLASTPVKDPDGKGMWLWTEKK